MHRKVQKDAYNINTASPCSESLGVIPLGPNDMDVIHPLMHVVSGIGREEIIFEFCGKDHTQGTLSCLFHGTHGEKSKIDVHFHVSKEIWDDIDLFNGIPRSASKGLYVLLMKGIQERSGEFEITNQEFGQRRRINRQNAAVQLLNTLRTLYSLDLTMKRLDSVEPVYSHLRVLERYDHRGRGRFFISFSKYFTNLICNKAMGHHMPIPPELIWIDDNKFQYSFKMGLGILKHMRMMHDKGERWARVIPVKMLLENYVPELIEKYAKMLAHGHANMTREFCDPVLRNIEAAIDTFENSLGFGSIHCKYISCPTGEQFSTSQIKESDLHKHEKLMGTAVLLPPVKDWKNFRESFLGSRHALKRKKLTAEDLPKHDEISQVD